MTADVVAGVCAAAAVLLAVGAYRALVRAADAPDGQARWAIAGGAGVAVAALLVVACTRPLSALLAAGLMLVGWLLRRSLARGRPAEADIVVQSPLLGDATSRSLAVELARIEAERRQAQDTRATRLQ